MLIAAVFGTAATVASVSLVAIAVESTAAVAAPVAIAASVRAPIAPTTSEPPATSVERRNVPARARADRSEDRQARPAVVIAPPQQAASPAPPEAPPAQGAVDVPRSPDVRAAHELPGTSTALPKPPAPMGQQAAPVDTPVRSPWNAAADAGVTVGRGSQKAAVATAGFFSKLGKSIARSF
jgi:hypothetical protein